MSNLKAQKMASDLKIQLSLLIRELKDPRISISMISIVDIDISNDCSYAKVYISSIKGIDNAKLAVKGLNNSLGFLKKRISNSLHLKKCPKIVFIADNSIEYGNKLDELISKLSNKNKENS